MYVEGVARAAGDSEIDRLMAVFSQRSLDRGADAWDADDVTGEAPHRLYVARAVAHFVLDDHDRRQPVVVS